MTGMNQHLVLAYGLLCVLTFANNGAFFPPLVPLLLGVFYLALMGLWGRKTSLWEGRPWESWLLLGFFGISLLRPLGSFPRPLWLLLLEIGCMGALTGVGVWALAPGRQLRPGRVALLMTLLAGAAGVLTLWITPVPRIDVYVLQDLGGQALLELRNPYSLHYPNPYDAEETGRFFGVDGSTARLTHYPYPPLSLLVTSLAWALFRDVRMAFLLCQLGSGWLLYTMGRKHGERQGVLALLLFLLHPRGLFVLEQSWTEPLCVLFAVWWCYLDQGKPSWVVRGLCLLGFLSAKQYGVLALPIAWVVLRHRGERVWAVLGLAGLGSLGLVIPFFLWDRVGFVQDVLLFQIQQPFRADALSLPALVYFFSGYRLPGALGFLGMASMLGYLLLRRLILVAPAAALGLVYLAFFFTAKQAFCNYYYLAAGLLLAGAVAPGAQLVGRGAPLGAS